MCGIAGYVKKDLDYRYTAETLSSMLKALSIRGRDATGWAWPSNSKVSIAKTNADAFQAVEVKHASTYLTGAGLAPWAMFHTRAATNGSPEASVNNHPIFTNHCVLVHNGVIYTYEQVNTEGQCDSEVIGRLIDSVGIIKALKKVQGSIATILHLFSEPDSLYIYREDNPLYFGETEHAYVFASTETCCDILGADKDTLKQLPTYEVVQVTPQGYTTKAKLSTSTAIAIPQTLPSAYQRAFAEDDLDETAKPNPVYKPRRIQTVILGSKTENIQQAFITDEENVDFNGYIEDLGGKSFFFPDFNPARCYQINFSRSEMTPTEGIWTTPISG